MCNKSCTSLFICHNDTNIDLILVILISICFLEIMLHILYQPIKMNVAYFDLLCAKVQMALPNFRWRLGELQMPNQTLFCFIEDPLVVLGCFLLFSHFFFFLTHPQLYSLFELHVISKLRIRGHSLELNWEDIEIYPKT